MDDEDDDEQDVVALDIQTHPETLEIEWSRLDSEMQMTELQAVVRSGMIQEAAKKELSIVSSNGKKLAGEEGIILPTDEDLRIIKNKVANSKDSNAYLTVERGGKLGTFLRWYLGEDYSGNSNLRKFFLHCESLFAITNKKVRKKYIDQGFTTSLEAEFLLAQAKESLVVMSALAAVGIPSVDDLSIVDEIIKFRSWYKAGQLVVDYDNAEEER